MHHFSCKTDCLQCFGVIGWASGRASDLSWVTRCWHGYLSGARCRLFAYGPADATASQTPSSLASLKFRMALPSWCRLTQVVLEKRPLKVSSIIKSWVCWLFSKCKIFTTLSWLGSRVLWWMYLSVCLSVCLSSYVSEEPFQQILDACYPCLGSVLLSSWCFWFVMFARNWLARGNTIRASAEIYSPVGSSWLDGVWCLWVLCFTCGRTTADAVIIYTLLRSADSSVTCKLLVLRTRELIVMRPIVRGQGAEKKPRDAEQAAARGRPT